MNPRVYPVLSAYAALAALVGDRIYPIIAPQSVVRPYVVFTPIGISTEQYFASPEDVDYDRVSIDCWAGDYPTAQAIAAACRLALAGNGYLASGMSDYEGEETKLYRATIDWSFVTLS
jgi:hypothetical protein